MNKPKVILQVNAPLDGRIAFTPNSTMFTPVDKSLQPFQTEPDDWKFFNEKVDLTGTFAKLFDILYVKCILTSSGGKLAGALIRENLLDEINILFNPTIYGGTNTPISFRSPDINPPDILPNKFKAHRIACVR